MFICRALAAAPRRRKRIPRNKAGPPGEGHGAARPPEGTRDPIDAGVHRPHGGHSGGRGRPRVPQKELQRCPRAPRRGRPPGGPRCQPSAGAASPPPHCITRGGRAAREELFMFAGAKCSRAPCQPRGATQRLPAPPAPPPQGRDAARTPPARGRPSSAEPGRDGEGLEGAAPRSPAPRALCYFVRLAGGGGAADSDAGG